MDTQLLADGTYPVLEQQQHLLYPAQFEPAYTTSLPLVEQIELGGARVEETLNRFNCHYQTLFFLSSWNVIIAAILGIFSSLISLEISTFINCIFLLLFGSAIMVLDIPGDPRWAGSYRRYIRKYAALLTRLTGRALWLLYLGCMIIVCLWPDNRKQKPSIFFVLILLSGTFVTCVACLGLFIALRKSLRLEKIRKSLINTYQGHWRDVYRKYAVNDPAHGMRYDEFNRMASDYSHGHLIFDLADLRIIYNALDDHQKNAINEVEFGNWLTAGLSDDSDPCSFFAKNFSMIYL